MDRLDVLWIQSDSMIVIVKREHVYPSGLRPDRRGSPNPFLCVISQGGRQFYPNSLSYSGPGGAG